MTAVVTAPHRSARPVRLVAPVPPGRSSLARLAPTGTAPFERSALDVRPGPRPRLEVVPGGRSAVLRRRSAGLARSLASQAPSLPRASALAVVALLATTVAALVIATSAAEPLPAPVSAPPAPAAVPAVAVADAPVPIAARAYVVQPGDTLWGIARSLQPTGDVRSLVDELSRRLDGRTLQPGMQLPLDGVAVR